MAWETVIGLEVHAELATRSKMFCACETTFGAAPNTQCCPVCMGLPGALPVVNVKAVELAARACLAFHCEIGELTLFDRKNYFYPDLPKAYQISQLYHPLGRNGYLDIVVRGGSLQRIGIHEIHMEEDAGKLIHDERRDVTKIDFNRCGIPLIEIVSEPDFRTAEEVLAYLVHLKSVLDYLEVSDCKMQEGSLRVDINLSVRRTGECELGTRTEMKNLSSFRAVAAAIEYERSRQINVLETGNSIIQETHRWDEKSGRNTAMRSKETAKDYRYFPEPDIPPLIITKEWLEQLQADQPELADEKQKRYQIEFGLTRSQAELLTSSRELAEFYETAVSLSGAPKETANWMLGEVLRLLNESGKNLRESLLKPIHLADIIRCAAAKQINRAAAKEVLEAAFQTGADVPTYIQEHALEQIGDETFIQKVIAQVLSEERKAVEDFKTGKKKAYSFLVGQCMKRLKGKGDPQTVNQLLRDALPKID